MSANRFWLLKTEPEDFSWDDMLRLHVTKWDGVRNNQALANLRKAAVNDLAFFYHTGKERAIKGVVRVVKKHDSVFNDDSAIVEVEVAFTLMRSVSLEEIKSASVLRNMVILKQPRLSVAEVTEEEWLHLIKLSNN